MAENVVFNIKVQGGKTVTLPTAGKYVDRNIVITSTGGGGIDTSDATATSGDLLLGKTAYVNDEKIEGTIETYDYSNSENVKLSSNFFQDYALIRQNVSSTGVFANFTASNIDEYINMLDFSKFTSLEKFFYRSSLKNVPIMDTSNVASFSETFYNCTGIKTFPTLDFSKATTASSIFYNCTSLKNVDYQDFSNIKSFTNGFYNCSSLVTVPIINASKCTSFGNIFRDCYQIKKIIMHTNSATSIGAAFSRCYKLEEIDFTNLDNITTTSSSSSVFYQCYSLKKIIIREMNSVPAMNANFLSNSYHFLGTVNSTYNPEGLADGYIYVPDDWVETVKSSTNWSSYADQIKPLSELEE